MYCKALTTLAVVSLALSVGCSESTESTGTASAGGADTALAWLLASAPEGVVDINATKQTAVAGDTVTLRGIIGGRVEPLATDSAVFVMMDVNLYNNCTALNDDHCPTPWDYCCATPEDKLANNATVQIVDAAGVGIAANLRDHDINPLDTVVVTGTVDPRPSTDVLIIKATSIYKAD